MKLGFIDRDIVSLSMVMSFSLSGAGLIVWPIAQVQARVAGMAPTV